MEGYKYIDNFLPRLLEKRLKNTSFNHGSFSTLTIPENKIH